MTRQSAWEGLKPESYCAPGRGINIFQCCSRGTSSTFSGACPLSSTSLTASPGDVSCPMTHLPSYSLSLLSPDKSSCLSQNSR